MLTPLKLSPDCYLSCCMPEGQSESTDLHQGQQSTLMWYFDFIRIPISLCRVHITYKHNETFAAKIIYRQNNMQIFQVDMQICRHKESLGILPKQNFVSIAPGWRFIISAVTLLCKLEIFTFLPCLCFNQKTLHCHVDMCFYWMLRLKLHHEWQPSIKILAMKSFVKGDIS